MIPFDVKFGLALMLAAGAVIGIRASTPLRQAVGWRVPEVDGQVTQTAAAQQSSESAQELLPPPASPQKPAEPKKFPAPAKKQPPSGLTSTFPAKPEPSPKAEPSPKTTDKPAADSLGDLSLPGFPDLSFLAPKAEKSESAIAQTGDKSGADVVTEFVPFTESLEVSEAGKGTPAAAALPPATAPDVEAKPAPTLDLPPPRKAPDEPKPPMAMPALPPPTIKTSAESEKVKDTPALPALELPPPKEKKDPPKPRPESASVAAIPAPPRETPGPKEPHRIGAVAPQVRVFDQPASSIVGDAEARRPSSQIDWPGDNLKPPAHPFFQRYRDRREYFVRHGDTLEQIAVWLYQDAAMAERIAQLNADQLRGKEPRVGATLKLP